MTDIGFHRTHINRLCPSFITFVNGLYFHRICKTIADPVCFYIINIINSKIGIFECFFYRFNLYLRIWCCETVAASVVFYGRTFDNDSNRIVIFFCIALTFQNHHTATFTTHITFCIIRKCFACVVW